MKNKLLREYHGIYLEETPFSKRSLIRESGTFLLSCLRIWESGLLIPELTAMSSSSGSASVDFASEEKQEKGGNWAYEGREL